MIEGVPCDQFILLGRATETAWSFEHHEATVFYISNL